MLQLVGKWDKRSQEDKAVMDNAFLHNQRMLKPHGVESVSITEPTNATLIDIIPAYWKIDVILELCASSTTTGSPRPDLVLFLDGDTVIMDPHARVEFLWAYHSNLNMMNKDTAIRTLQVWQDVALELFHWNSDSVYHPKWMEQNALHFMLQTHQWRTATKNSSVWDSHLQKHGLDHATYAASALHSRIRHVTQCALNTYPAEIHPRRCRQDLFAYSRGHYILHTAGYGGKKRFAMLDKYQRMEVWSTSNLTLQEAAKEYFQSHPFEYSPNETLLDWEYDRPCSC